MVRTGFAMLVVQLRTSEARSSTDAPQRCFEYGCKLVNFSSDTATGGAVATLTLVTRDTPRPLAELSATPAIRSLSVHPHVERPPGAGP